jgi:transposase
MKGTTEREVFEARVEQVLAPRLWTGQVLVMDSLSAQKGHKVSELIEKRR